MAGREGSNHFYSSSTDVENVVNSMEYLAPLSSRDVNTRKQALENVCTLVEQYLNGYSSPLQEGRGSVLKSAERGFHLQSLLPGILRLSSLCPFDDVREKMSALFGEIKNRGKDLQIPKALNNGPSYIISKSEVLVTSTSGADVTFALCG